MTRTGEDLTAIRCKVYEVMNELKRHEEKLNGLQSMKDARIYTLDYIVEQRDKEMAEYRSKDTTLRSELRTRIDNLFDQLEQSKANINSQAFSNALNLITTLGAEMDSKTLGDIISSFRGQMGELNLLRKACISANVGDCLCVFDDFIIGNEYREVMKRQTDNLLVFSRSFGIVSEMLGEDLTIDAESVVKDATRAFSNNRFVL